MSTAPVYLASDVHLGAVPSDREKAFVRWLDHAAAHAGEIVINGDLFDFWFEYRAAIPRGHSRVLGALARIVDGGVPIHMMGGNHDWWGGSFLEDEIGLTFYQHPVELVLAGRRTLLAHGDGLGRGDLGYRALRLVLRGRLSQWGFRWLHPDVGAWIARRVSMTESRGEGRSDAARARSAALEAWARARLEEQPELDLVVLGHTHEPVLREVGEDRWYVNGGDWLHHRSYLVLRPGEPPDLREFEDG